jgi:hypothetical protein
MPKKVPLGFEKLIVTIATLSSPLLSVGPPVPVTGVARSQVFIGYPENV